jgi:hypothetical protein
VETGTHTKAASLPIVTPTGRTLVRGCKARTDGPYYGNPMRRSVLCDPSLRVSGGENQGIGEIFPDSGGCTPSQHSQPSHRGSLERLLGAPFGPTGLSGRWRARTQVNLLQSFERRAEIREPLIAESELPFESRRQLAK